MRTRTGRRTGRGQDADRTRDTGQDAGQGTGQDAGQDAAAVNSPDDTRSIALSALQAIASDPDAPAAARASAARTLLEVEGAIGRTQQPKPQTADKPLSSMTRSDLEAELARLRASRQT